MLRADWALVSAASCVCSFHGGSASQGTKKQIAYFCPAWLAEAGQTEAVQSFFFRVEPSRICHWQVPKSRRRPFAHLSGEDYSFHSSSLQWSFPVQPSPASPLPTLAHVGSILSPTIFLFLLRAALVECHPCLPGSYGSHHHIADGLPGER